MLIDVDIFSCQVPVQQFLFPLSRAATSTPPSIPWRSSQEYPLAGRWGSSRSYLPGSCSLAVQQPCDGGRMIICHMSTGEYLYLHGWDGRETNIIQHGANDKHSARISHLLRSSQPHCIQKFQRLEIGKQGLRVISGYTCLPL